MGGGARRSFQTGAPAFIEVDGILRRASGAVLDGVVIERLVAKVFDDTGEGILRSGRAIDCSYAVASGPRQFRRFRCNRRRSRWEALSSQPWEAAPMLRRRVPASVHALSNQPMTVFTTGRHAGSLPGNGLKRE